MFSLLDFCFCPKTSGLWSFPPTEEGEESIDAPRLDGRQMWPAQCSSSLAKLPREPCGLGLGPSILAYKTEGL